MRTECSRNCWIAGGVAGLLVWLSIGLFGSGGGWGAGLALGLLTTWILGGILSWGVCQGAGNRTDNDALLAGGWRDEPFNPTRRVVRAGGDAVSVEPLGQAERIPGGAPLDSRTVTPGGHAARPRIVAGAGANAPVRSQARGPDGRASSGAGQDASSDRTGGDSPSATHTGATDDPALLQAAPGAPAQVAHRTAAPVEGIEPEKPEVRASGSEAVALEATGFAEPRTDSEAGSDPRAPEGGIEPLSAVDEAPPEERAKSKDKNGKSKDKKKDKDKKKGGKSADPGFAEGESRVMTLTGDEDGEAATGADDLTRIRGIGPMLQTWLAGYGVTRVEQIAGWDDADIARYAGMMGRMGHRIRDEDWVGQARLLAAGGETAHSRVADTGEAG